MSLVNRKIFFAGLLIDLRGKNAWSAKK